MDAGETDFLTTADAARFVREKAAREKRSYRVTRSDRTRFCVACVDKMCPFQVRFWRRRDGKFHITRNVAHTCTLFQTTVTHMLIRVMLDVCVGERTRFKLFDDRSCVDDAVMIFVVTVMTRLCPKLRLSLHLVVFRIDSKTSINYDSPSIKSMFCFFRTTSKT